VGRIELELKGVVPDADQVRTALLAAGGRLAFKGQLQDRRYDRGGELSGRDEVLRVRTYIPLSGTPRAELGWKGPTRFSVEGYKQREERELSVTDGAPSRFIEALGYTVVHAIDRYIEVFEFTDGHARLEWYPRMDVLIEVEGAPTGIERIIAATGLPRTGFSSEALTEFTARYDAAHPGARSLVALEGWSGPAS
jgi:adenylate cyclase class IV